MQKYKRHGLTINGRHPLYVMWQNMKGRCLNPNHDKYHRYGGRGITIDSDWMNVANFVEWALASGWEPGLSIDREDPDKNYNPDNCRWLTKPQNSKRGGPKRITLTNAAMILASDEPNEILAKRYGVGITIVKFIRSRMKA